MDNKYDVFISYSRHDTDVVNAFVDRLEREGFCVWIDRAGIESGDAFKKIILQAIKSSAVVLFFSSQFSNQSGWTAKEIGVAVKYKKPIIPILLDGSNFNEEVEFDLINLDFIDYQDVTVRGIMMDRLVKSLKTKITNPIGQKKAEEARLKAEAAERERLEQERRKKEEAERKAREEAERKAREAAERERKALLATSVSPTPHGNTPNPPKKKTFWIALAAVAAVALLLLLLLKPKKEEPVVVDPDTETYQACQTVQDYRYYITYFGLHAEHYAEAKDFIDRYVADSLQRVKDSLAQVEAQLLAQQQTEAEQAENEAYGKCTTVAACDRYLKNYPQGRYVQEVRTKKAQLEAQAQQQSQQSLTGTANGHEWVDLGLPSGTLWATCNIGASKPEDYGNYYAWGETSTKSRYYWDTYRYANYANGDHRNMTKYCSKSDYGNNGFTDNWTTLQSADDPATANWGSGWQTPSQDQLNELASNTTNQWTTRNGVNGMLFTSKNGQTIFLPAAGFSSIREGVSELFCAGSRGYYWSKSLSTGYPDSAYHLCLDSYSCNGYNSRGRDLGLTVRPVRQK